MDCYVCQDVVKNYTNFNSKAPTFFNKSPTIPRAEILQSMLILVSRILRGYVILLERNRNKDAIWNIYMDKSTMRLTQFQQRKNSFNP